MSGRAGPPPAGATGRGRTSATSGQRRRLLKLAAALLHYPAPSYQPVVAAVEEELKRGFRSAPAELSAALRDLRTFCAQVRAIEPIEWECRYVQAFDFQKEQALWLTYHEVGDAIERGRAMVELKQRIRAAGFLCPDDELPDHIPLLLEFLAEKPADVPDGDLPGRLAPVLEKIAAATERREPLYAPVLRAARTALAVAAANSNPASADGVNT